MRDEEARANACTGSPASASAAGERVYVVVPAIEEGAREVAATRETADRIAAALPGGRDRRPPRPHAAAPSAPAVLRGLRRAAGCPILVSTTVVEVGVDVPEATLMVVENAEVFGLAQLHQLRGRVGRSARPSWCALIVGPGATEEARRRLAVLETTSDGFVIAEKDLEARGPGDLLGHAGSRASRRCASPIPSGTSRALGEARRRASLALRAEGQTVRERPVRLSVDGRRR